jgi:hypothetical protein
MGRPFIVGTNITNSHLRHDIDVYAGDGIAVRIERLLIEQAIASGSHNRLLHSADVR